MAYHIISMRCCKVGRGITAASEKNNNLSYVRNLHYGQMSQNLPLRQQAFLLVENGMKQIVSIDNTFHQNIGSPSRTIRTASRAASSGSSMWRVFTYSRYFCRLGYFCRMAESPIIRNSAISSSSARAMAYSVFGSLAQTTAIRFRRFKGFEMGCQLVKVSNRFHNVRFLANIRKRIEKYIMEY